MHALSREQRDVAIRRALEFAKPRADRLSEWAGPSDPAQWPMSLLVPVALHLLDDGRRFAVQALDAARDHIETVSGHPDDPVEAEVVRLLVYAAERLSGHLERGLDPETLGDEERVRIYNDAFEIAGREIDALAAERPELVTDAQVLSAAFSMVCERLAAMATAPRTTTCTWCGHRAAVADAIRHALECAASPGAAAIAALHRLTAIFDGPVAAPEHAQLDGVLVWLARANTDVAVRITEAENRRIVAQGVGQVHERDCPDPLAFHVTCSEPVTELTEVEFQELCPKFEVPVHDDNTGVQCRSRGTVSWASLEGHDCCHDCNDTAESLRDDSGVVAWRSDRERRRVLAPRVKTHAGVTPNDSVVANQLVDDPPSLQADVSSSSKIDDWYKRSLPISPDAEVVIIRDPIRGAPVAWSLDERRSFIQHAQLMGWRVDYENPHGGGVHLWRDVRVTAAGGVIEFHEEPCRVVLAPASPHQPSALVVGGYAAWCRALQTS